MDTLEDLPTLPVVVCSAQLAASALAAELRRLSAQLRVVARGELLALLEGFSLEDPLVVLLDDSLLAGPGRAALPERLRRSPTLRLITIGVGELADDTSVPEARLTAVLAGEPRPGELFRAARSALREAAYEARHRKLAAEVSLRAAQIHELNRIGVALSTERNQERLLVRILSALRDLTAADAGSLYLAETGADGQRVLRFTVAQNDSIPTPALVRFTLPIEPRTLAGYVAWSGQPLNIPDVYAISGDQPYSFSKAFDEKTGYRTRSMLVMPMKNQLGEIIGVVQLINKRGSSERLPDPPHLCCDIVPFDDLAVELSTSLTSQAAVCIENNVLYEGLNGNIQELKDTQAQLVQSEKLASLGQLTAGVAHEINNPLAFTRNNTSLAIERIASAARRIAVTAWIATSEEDPFDRIDAGEALLRRLAEDPALAADVREVQGELGGLSVGERVAILDQFMDYARQRKEMDEGKLDDLLFRVGTLLEESTIGLGRVAEIVRGLRNFSRLDEAHFQDADIDEGIKQTLMILREPAREQSVTLVPDLTLTRPVPCFPAKLNQVILNLINNAIDASPAGSEVRVITRERGDHVEIMVSDSGHGIPEAIRTKIFDPFFTTKPVGKGTGLGLAISYRIIQEHRGKISVAPNQDGVGVVFSIRIPVAHPEQQEQVVVAEVQ
ncbi:MAG: GAF domain-containing protein [Nannocystis sp.]|nr:GAF domain-containing protein [Nannocystis sp.]